MSTLLLVGCGKMGGAMLRAWQEAGLFNDIYVVDPHFQAPSIHCLKSCADLPQSLRPDIACIAVKPQNFSSITLPETVTPRLVLSIMAGITLTKLENRFPQSVSIRAMPNLPASIGAGATIACTNNRLSAADKQLIDNMLAATGYCAWVDDEKQLDAVTALSGSGPAYLFRLIEILSQAGTELGLPTELATDLAKHTIIGAAKLAEQSDQPAKQLCENVTSKGGTTEAALQVLDSNNALQLLFNKALEAAVQRSRELSAK